jgi:hypothetical protein
MARIDRTNQGKRVELVSTNDRYTRLRSGALGTYELAIVNSDMTQHCIRWDEGSSLMLIEGVDQFKFVD